MDQIINFKINTELFTSRSEAILALENIIFTQGEPVIAIYGTTSQNAKIILAVGKRNGAGKNAFEIISTKEDMSETLNIINSLNNEFTEHIKAEAGDKLGHVITGGDIVFSGGIGTVVSAGKVKNKLTFTGGTFEGTDKTTFDGSEAVTIKIPSPSFTVPKPLGHAIAGESKEWARADHVHEAPKSVSGNAGSADKLSSKRNIILTGAVTGGVVTDFSGDITINTSKNHTHDISEVTGLRGELNTLEATKAPIESPIFTGTPEAPTAPQGTNTNQLATTAFVIKEIGEKIEAAVALKFKGTLGTTGTVKSLPAQHTTGDVYVATTGAPNVSGLRLEPGDIIICIKDGSTANDSDWTVVQTNIDGAVTGPGSAVSGNLVLFNGTTGKVISDSGLSLADLAKVTTTISAGPGLTGGGSIGGNQVISHASQPTTGTNAGGNSGAFVTNIKIDSFGHVVEALKGDLTGSYLAPSGEYISGITLSGNTLSGNSKPFPNIEIENGEVGGSEEFVTGISVNTILNNHRIQVNKGTIPGIIVTGDGGEGNPRKYVSGIESDGHHGISFTTSEESGMVKVSKDGSADYLGNKVLSGVSSGNTYATTVTQDTDALRLTTTISEIDGGDDQGSQGKRQVIRVKRYTTGGILPSGLASGEIAINLVDNYLYVGNEEGGVQRIYPNATPQKDGLLSAEDKSRLEKAISDIADHASSLGTINTELDVLEEDLKDTKEKLTEKISQESEARKTADQEFKENLNTETQERTTEDIAIREYIDSTKSELNEKIDKLIGSGGETEGGLAAEVEARIQGDKYNFDLLKFAIHRVNSSAGFEDPDPDDDSIYSNFPSLSDTHYLGGQSNLVGCLRILDQKIYELEQALTIKTL